MEKTIIHDHVNSYQDQDNFEIGIFINGNIVGCLEYTLFENTLTVSMVRVLPNETRKGYASELYREMVKKHPNARYIPGMYTDLGAKLKIKW